jgi:hypothetical protein
MSSKNFYGLTGDVTVDGGILNVGNAQLYANTGTSNVGIGTSNPEFELDVHGNANVGVLYSTFLHGDGSNIQNIVSSQWEGSPGDPIYYASNVGIANTSPVTTTMQIGSNVVVDDVGSNVIHVTGNIYADYLVGDGSQLTGIAASLDQIVDQGNTVSNTIQIVSGQDASSNVGLVTWEGVGISVSNANPTGEYQFGVGSNLLVNVYSSNVMTVDGNVFAQKMTLGTVTITPAYNLQQITETGATSNQTLVLSNVTTGLTADANIVVDGNVTAGSMITSGNVNAGNVITSTNINVGGDLSVTGNVYVDDMRVAEVASNLVTYDSTTGELLDSGGLFSNKLAVVSEQPPIALTGASTVVEKHGTYTIEASSTATGSEVYHLFDKNEETKWVTGIETYSSQAGNEGTHNGGASLADVDGEWAKITMPYKTILRHVKIKSTNSSIKDVTLVGLNADGLTWSDLKIVNGLNEETSTIIVNATTHHKTYGLIVRATNIGSSQAEIGDLKLFTESFSIDGGKVEMASSAVMGGETTIDQHGPHGRGEAKLKKYPEIAFDASKVDTFGNSNAYTQAGYEISSSSRYSPSYDVLSAFNGTYLIDHFASKNLSFSTSSPYNYTLFTNNVTDKDSTQYTGEEIKVKMPYKIKLSKVQIISYVGASGRKVASGHIFGSNTGANGSWTKLADFTGLNTGTSGYETVSVSTTEYYEWYSLVVTNINGIEGLLNIYELEFYGYEELATQGDTSVDTTFTSIMNTPQTTGANVYTDAKLSSDFTNHVTGPTPVGTAAVHDNTNKYWEMNGQLTSNIAVEANTFLEGDAPHSVSVWFNSSNLEANVSNTCVFSISDQEKLDSMNLDLQSNTWHNLTYAYQGEGGSRVTYLDGRKVAEDQAEDTFGEYPPFAMTGYSQGGYVVSQGGGNYTSGSNALEPWELFDKSYTNSQTSWAPRTSDGTLNYTVVEGSYKRYNTTLGTATRLSGDTEYGEYVKLELPDKIRLNYIVIHPHPGSTDYATKFPAFSNVYGSNDDVKWTEITNWTPNDFTLPVNDSDEKKFIANATKSYKYLALVVTGVGGTTHNETVFNGLQFYGHRENDLVRLPDPTNVLKYPHIAMTGPAQRGYVASASSVFNTYNPWETFDENNPVGGNAGAGAGWASSGPSTTDDTYFGDTGLDVGTTSHHIGSVTGEWIQIELPHALTLSSIDIESRSETSYNANGYDHGYPKDVVLYGSLNGSSWSTVKSFTTVNKTASEKHTEAITSSTAYKYYALVVESIHVTSSTTVVWCTIGQLRLYGTEEASSVPIQIGGGNIDKVANFRVYDKFVGEDQALEIWDAQKDEFGRAKSSMTLQKGRLGIGTTEPEGRLAVLDEPHNLEEFPPRAMQSSKVSINARTGYYDTHFEGHGTFTAYGSHEYVQPTDARVAWKAFSKQTGGNSTSFGYMNSGNHYTSGGTIYTGPESNGGKRGDFLGLKFPYKVKITHFFVMSFVTSTSSRGPKEGYLLGRINGGDWQQVHFFQNKIFKALEYTKFEFENDTFYDEYILVVTKTTGATVWNASELRYFGTREQGQSVLHDGTLTLTKSLNVPRIGPPIDADDTPRRDRLVVEYNTSTNPTFEGAVRDTSGRGLDAILRDATYNATEKSFRIGSSQDIFLAQGIPGKSGDITNVSYSIWFKADSVSSDAQVIMSQISAYAANVGLNLILNYNDLQIGIGGLYSSSTAVAGVAVDAISPGQWYHIVVIKKGVGEINSTTFDDIFEMYINGEKKTLTHGGGTATLNIGTDNWLIIGAIKDVLSTSEEFIGDVSSIKYYDTALTAEEVKTLYDMGRCDEGHHMVNFSKTRVGIGLGDGEAPRAALDVRDVGIFNNSIVLGDRTRNYLGVSGVKGGNILVNQGGEYVANKMVHASISMYPTATASNPWHIGAGDGYKLNFGVNSGIQGYIGHNANGGSLNFTGQHRTFIKDVPFSQAGDLEGLIVSSDQNKYIKMSGGIEAGSNAITTNESLPVVSLSTTTNDKKCFGVISASEDPEERSDAFGSFVTPYEKEKGDTRVYINSVGEGAIWVTNINGSLESGDYITTSNVAGYGQKQDDDVLHNYTVAKITMDCDFEPATQPVQQILRSNVVQTYYLGNVHKVKSVPHEFVTTVVGAEDAWSNVSVSPSDVTYTEWSNLEANAQNTYTLTYTQTSNVVYDTKYTLTTTANVTESDPWDRVSIDPPGVTYAEYSNLEANTQNTYTLTFTQTTTDTKTPEEWSALESNTQSLYNKVYYQSVEEEVAATWPGAVAHTRVTDVIENELDEHGQIQWEDHPTETEKAYKIRFLDANGVETDEANTVHIAAFVGCTYHCG